MKNRIIKIVVAVALVLAIGAIAGWRYFNAAYEGEARWVYLSKGMTREQAKSELEKSLGDWAGRAFDVYARVAEDGDVPRGAYYVKPGERVRDFARRMLHRRQDPVKVVINNVRTLDDLAARLASQMEFDSEEFMSACDSVLPGAGFRKPEYIAAFLPDTYEFYWTSPAVDAVGRLLDYRNRFWSDERRGEARAMGLTPVQVATLASIAEEETNDRAERGVVARLYLNRMQRGMPLQADPTVKFAVGDFSLRRILSKHLKAESPYNTYRHAGLPPGPIRMADKATMESLLNSRPHNYLYMCAKPDFSGRHNFAPDFATHKRNAAAYRQALNARGVTGR